MARLLAAMSGGVDSSVAAAIARDQGHDVTGVTLRQWDDPSEQTRLTKGCSTADAVADAGRAAATLGLAHYTLDFRDVFAREVIDPFVREYASGRTPNPCVRCNELVRFGALADKAGRLGFEGLVTGHWARTRGGRLMRAANRERDQTYMLYAVSRQQLSFAHFPLGTIASKQEVREIARGLGLPNADRPESVDVCFVPPRTKTGDFVRGLVPAAVRSGPVVDSNGRVLGEHRGLAYYTVGQRRGLPQAARDSFVALIDADANAVVVTGASGLERTRITATRPRFAGGMPADGARVEAVVRYRAQEVPAVFRATADGFELALERAVRAAAPGQAVVCYDGQAVLGGGTISSAS
jgi:tRNA-specific 2-thiouridylase